MGLSVNSKRYFVYGFVFCKNPLTLRKDICTIIASYSDGVFASIVDKNTIIMKSWTPERLGNYVFGHSVHENILNKLALNDIRIHYDSGRLAPFNQGDFDGYLADRVPSANSTPILEIKGLSSLLEPCVWAADFLAGSFYRKYALGDEIYANTILNTCSRIGDGYRIFWR